MLTENQRNKAMAAIAGRSTELATYEDLEAFFYEAQVAALDDLSDTDLLVALGEAGFTEEDL